MPAVALMLAPRSVAPGISPRVVSAEERPEHAVAVDRLLEGEPGHLVQAEHDRHAVSHLHVQRGVFETQRQVPFEAGVGGRPHIRREPDASRGRESRLDVEIAARDVEGVVAVLLVQFGGVLQERDDAERHRRESSSWPAGSPCRRRSGPTPAPDRLNTANRRQTEVDSRSSSSSS